MAQTEDVKSSYGPAMTPNIFAAKWLAKFRDFLLNKHRNHAYKTHEPRTCVLVSEGFDHVFHFYAQAAEVHLTQKDFPDEAPLSPWSNLQDNGVLPVEHLRIAVVNPFHGSMTLLYMLDRFVEQLEGMKTKGWRIEGMRWQELPLRWRQRMNEVFLQIDEAREKGWWVFPKVEKIEAMVRAAGIAGKKEEAGRDAGCES